MLTENMEWKLEPLQHHIVIKQTAMPFRIDFNRKSVESNMDDMGICETFFDCMLHGVRPHCEVAGQYLPSERLQIHIGRPVQSKRSCYAWIIAQTANA